MTTNYIPYDHSDDSINLLHLGMLYLQEVQDRGDLVIEEMNKDDSELTDEGRALRRRFYEDMAVLGLVHSVVCGVDRGEDGSRANVQLMAAGGPEMRVVILSAGGDLELRGMLDIEMARFNKRLMELLSKGEDVNVRVSHEYMTLINETTAYSVPTIEMPPVD